MFTSIFPRYRVRLVSKYPAMNVYFVFRRRGFNKWLRIGRDTQCLHLSSAQDVIRRDIREHAIAPKVKQIKVPKPRTQWSFDARGDQI